MNLVPYLLAAIATVQLFLLMATPLPGLAHDFIMTMNVAAFIAFVYDKIQARRNGPRVPEKVLLSMTLVTGAAGAMLGRCLCHHKTQKTIFGFTGLLGIGVLGLLTVVLH